VRARRPATGRTGASAEGAWLRDVRARRPATGPTGASAEMGVDSRRAGPEAGDGADGGFGGDGRGFEPVRARRPATGRWARRRPAGLRTGAGPEASAWADGVPEGPSSPVYRADGVAASSGFPPLFRPQVWPARGASPPEPPSGGPSAAPPNPPSGGRCPHPSAEGRGDDGRGEEGASPWTGRARRRRPALARAGATDLRSNARVSNGSRPPQGGRRASSQIVTSACRDCSSNREGHFPSGCAPRVPRS